MKIKCSLLFLLLSLYLIKLSGQENNPPEFEYISSNDRLKQLERQLETLNQNGLNLEKTVTISLSGTVQELITFLAENTALNVSLSPEINQAIKMTFTEVKIKDILLYLCDTYNLTFKATGNIFHLLPYEIPIPEKIPKALEISFDSLRQVLTLNLQKDSLETVVRIISKLSGQNIAIAPSLRTSTINGFVSNLEVESALEQLMESNNLNLEKREHYFLITPPENEDSFEFNSANTGTTASQLYVKKVEDRKVKLKARNVSILDIIQAVALELDANYYLSPGITSSQGGDFNKRSNLQSQQSNANIKPVSVQLQNATFLEVLDQLFQNSDYTYQVENDLTLIGRRNAEGLRVTELYQLQNRSARGLLEIIPTQLTEGIEIDSLFELNSLILSGSERNIEELSLYLDAIDQTVPVVNIELTIVDVQTAKLDEWGIEMGINPEGSPRGGSIVSSSDNQGGIDFSFSPNTINRLLGLLAGRGIINLGQVSNDFYLSLKALQEDGFVDIQSTPKLATLNSHPANLSIGQKRYYQEQQVNFTGFDRPIPVQATLFREVEANLDIQINPIVSGDDQVTLDIQFEQSEFLEDTGPNAPPPQVSRRFESMIRIRNGETIVLGGLEREAVSKSKRGVPFFSKIPLIGWLFGKHKKNKTADKLLIFVTPTIVN